jgi:hypothetical protein
VLLIIIGLLSISLGASGQASADTLKLAERVFETVDKYPEYRNANTIADIISKIEDSLAIKIVYNKKVEDTWSSVAYETCNDSIETVKYLTLLNNEYSKYPKDFFQRIGVKTIVLGRKLRFLSQNRAAIPDPYMNSLFLSIDGAYGDSSPIYLIHVMHHELHHCTEYAIWKNMSYKWRKWQKTNRFFFKYKGSGEIAYANESIDWYSMTHQKKGFLNLYSTTAQEEDRSELVTLIMSDFERKYIFQYYSRDKILRKKINIIVNELNTLCKTEDNYWQLSITNLVKQIE